MPKNIRSGVIFVIVLLLLAGSLPTASSDEAFGFTLHFLDVGHGDAAILQCDGQVMMIDGGDPAYSNFVYAYLKNTIEISHIDYMICTHPHQDHAGGLAAALNACTVGTVLAPCAESDNDAFINFARYVTAQGKTITVPEPGDSFALGSAMVTLLAPIRGHDLPNNNSIVARVVYGGTSFLFTGDAENPEENDILAAGYDLTATLLKVGHHGSATSTTEEFLQKINPEYAIISCGKDVYGCPAGEVLSRLKDAGTAVYRTDLQGTIICRSNGKALSFSFLEATPLAASPPPAAPAMPYDGPYIGNGNSKRFHYPWCPSVGDMKEKNKVEFSTREEAILHGYIPCMVCNP